MAEGGDQGFEVVPARIGGSGDPHRPVRRRRVPLGLVVAIAVLIPAVAWIGPRIEWRPEVDLSFLRPTPTPVPSTTPRPTGPPTSAPATPLPDVTVTAGQHPTEPFPIDVNGLRLVDPTTGELGVPTGLNVAEDAVFSAADGDGWWCVCFDRRPGGDRETATVEIRRVDSTGRTTMQRAIGEYVSTAPSPAPDFYNRFDLEISPDEGTAYLASATRNADTWTIAIEAIDLRTGVAAGRVDLGSIVIASVLGPTPPPEQGMYESYLTGPYIRLSPDGRRLLAWAWLDSYGLNGDLIESPTKAWMMDLDPAVVGGAIGRPVAFDEVAAGRLRQCNWVTWTAPDEIAGICWRSDPSTTTLSVAILRPDGSEVRRADIPGGTTSWIADPILDLANREIYLWQPSDHVLHRVDLDGGRTDRLDLDPQATNGGAGGSGPGSGESSRKRPDWATFGSDLRLYYGPQLIAEPGGSRLFAIGMLSDDPGYERFTFTSSGVWVFDATEFALLDRWAPVAAYGNIGLSRDGRWLLAAGAAGADEDGNVANWQSSLTIYDTVDGRPALQLGSLGTDSQVLQVPRD